MKTALPLESQLDPEGLGGSRFLLFSMFFSGADSRGVLMVESLQIFVIWGCFEGPIFGPFGTIRCKKVRFEKMMQKKSKTGMRVKRP